VSAAKPSYKFVADTVGFDFLNALVHPGNAIADGIEQAGHGNRVISIHRDNHRKSRIFQLLSDQVPDYRFVFNNQDCSLPLRWHLQATTVAS
jgi:hypothetical protein